MLRTPHLAALAALAVACGKPMVEPPPAPWTPGVHYPSPAGLNARGFLDRRGLIHAHSIHSHDACDNAPKLPDGGFDPVCLEDFRRDLCTVGHDFVFLTDHPTHYAEVDYPDTMLLDPAKGDTAVVRDGRPLANWLRCATDGGARPLIIPGVEGDLMPVGLERHPNPRQATYGTLTAPAVEELHDAGALVLIAHPENWTAEQLLGLPLDGFEMYNLHRNSFSNAAPLADLLLTKVEAGDFEGLPHPDALFTLYDLEEPKYLDIWGTVLSRGARLVTTMGTDCHRNTFPQKLADGERTDSYRRMMGAFSNHLLVAPGPSGGFDDLALKAALKAGRLYGTFDFLGIPQGFDFFATEGDATREMGAAVSLARGVTLTVRMPTVTRVDPAAPAAVLVGKLLRAKEHGWDEVLSLTEGEQSFTATQPGAYRFEVRMTPAHLRPFIGRRTDFIRKERPWVYSNAIYVVP